MTTCLLQLLRDAYTELGQLQVAEATGGSTTVSSPETKCYWNGADSSSSALSGSASASGDTVTCQTVTAQPNDGGSV